MKKISRRHALAAAGMGFGTSLIAAPSNEMNPHPAKGESYADQPLLAQQIQKLPNISGHEHWGSIDAIGWRNSGYIADLKMGAQSKDASLLDILFDPYSGMATGSKGIDIKTEAQEKGYDNLKMWFYKDPFEAWRSVQSILKGLESTGWFRCLNEGFRILYQTSLQNLLNTEPKTIDTVIEIDQEVRKRYANLMTWYKEAGRITGIQKILRPVQLEFGFEPENSAEREIMAPLLRIDHFCTFYHKPEASMRFCMEKTGIEPKNADAFREFLAHCFTLAEQAGFKGTKQLQAYHRPLHFVRPKDSEVLFESTPDREKQLTFGNFVMYECAELAARRGWPHQIHVGTHNLPDSNPLPLQPLIRSFPAINFVLLHGWPFIQESAYLAKMFHNVSIDPCWTPILNLEFFQRSLETYMGYLPDTKVMIGHDSTSVEMAAGSLSHCRTILGEILQRRMKRDGYSFESALSLASHYLSDNARRIYHLGE